MEKTKGRSWVWRWLRRGLVSIAAIVTLVVLYYVVEAWRGKRAWVNYRNQLVAQGVEMDLKTFIPPTVPDDQNFAMTPFLAPLLDFNPAPLKPGEDRWRDTNGYNRANSFAAALFKTDTHGKDRFDTELQALQTNAADGTNVSRIEEATAVLKDLEQYGPVLDELRTASHRRYARFNIGYDDEDPSAILLPHLALIKSLVQVLSLRARAELVLGKQDAALDDVELMLYVADSIKDEPLIISHLVRLATLHITWQLIAESLAERQWSDSQLRQLEARMSNFNLLKEGAWTMNGERVAIGTRGFELLRSRPSALDEMLANGDESQMKRVSLFPKGWTYFEQVNYQRLFMDDILVGVDTEARRVHPREVDDGASRLDGSFHGFWGWNHDIFFAMLLPPLKKITKKSAVGQTSMDEAAVACALERYRLAHGDYPEKLAALVPQFIAAIPQDIFSGEPLKYRRTDDGKFVLYSIGWNEKDDGGTIVLDQSHKTPDLDQGDWVWPMR